MRRFSLFPQRRDGSSSPIDNKAASKSDSAQSSWQGFFPVKDSTTNTKVPPQVPPQFLIARNLSDDLHIAVLLIVVAIVLLWKLVLHGHRRRTLAQKCGVPVLWHTPQGQSRPWLGQALQFLQHRPWDLMSAWHAQYGPIVCFPLLGHMLFSVGSPHLLKQVWQSKIASVKKDVHNVMKPFLVILGTGIVTSEDESWMKQRLKMSHPLRHEVLHMIPAQTLLAVQRLVRQWDMACDTHQPVAVGSALRHLTLQVISGTFLSLSAEESDSTFAQLYLPIVDESNTRVWHPYRSYMMWAPSFWNQLWNVYQLNAYVSQLIRARWRLRRIEAAHAQPGLASASHTKVRQADILDGMLRSCEKELGVDSAVLLPLELPEGCVRQLRDELKTFMLAGHETSAAMMTWALYELLGNDTLMVQVAQEALGVFGASLPDVLHSTSRDLPLNKLSELVLSEATLKEALRKYCVVPTVARRTIQDLHLDDGKHHYVIPRKSSILVNIQAVHHDPTIWPHPYRFDPYRFLPPRAASIQPYTFVPFIAGPRNCLGQHLALLESKMVLAMLVQRYQFALPSGHTVKVQGDWDVDPSQDPRHRYMVPIVPQKELYVTITRRHPPSTSKAQ